MKLFNLINIADQNINMILTGVKPDGSKVGYDFKNKVWLDNYIFANPDRITSIKDFNDSAFYRTIKRFSIVNFSTFDISHIEAFKDSDIYRDRILEIIIRTNFSDKEAKREEYRKKAKTKKNNKKKFKTPE